MKEYTYGVDVGGSFIKLGLFGPGAELMEAWQVQTNVSDGGTKIVSAVSCEILRNMKHRGITPAQVAGVGLGVPSPITSDGRALGGDNTGWGQKTVDIGQQLGSALGLTVKIQNDANLAALGEACFGVGKSYNSMVLLTIGTGVGGGVVVNRQIMSGHHGCAGEIGNIITDCAEYTQRDDGRTGRLEQYASAPGLVLLYRNIVKAGADSSSLRNAPTVSAKDVIDGAREGDPSCMQAVERFCELLGRVCSTIACVIDPEIFIIGGGVSNAGTILTDTIKKYYQKYAYFALRETEFALASLQNRAALYGAWSLIHENSRQKAYPS